MHGEAVVEACPFAERTARVDAESYGFIDDFIIGTLHDESIYDVLARMNEVRYGDMDDVVGRECRPAI